MSRILVTGSSGFIGRHVVKRALGRGHEVVAFVRDGRAFRARVPVSEAGVGAETGTGTGDGVCVVEGDVRDREAVERAVQGCHAVIHLAALYSFDSSQAGRMREINVAGTENVLRAAVAAGVERIVYTGTVGGTAFSRERLATEADLAGAEMMKGPYKRSKFEAEGVVRRLAMEGAPVVTVCPTAPIGPGDAKPTPTGGIVRDFLRRRMPAYVDTGLNFVHVGDVAEGHLLALERGDIGKRYLLGNIDGNLTLAQALEILSELTGTPAPRLRLPHGAVLAAARASEAAGRALRRPAAISVEAAQMASTRMWVDPSWSVGRLQMPQTPVRQAFKEAVEWFAEHA
ncbi:MAG: NAD-dependent epimerase/dehydratase family protein [Chloroflexi bacterium]|nr:NAD-dependent epimerase/dehydratase family protein [Chloroflexota bacterium]